MKKKKDEPVVLKEDVAGPAYVQPRVLVQRFPDSVSTVLGRDKILLDLDECAFSLLKSGFMESWLKNRIKEHLLDGGRFECLDPSTERPKSIYKIASEEEMIALAEAGQLAGAESKNGGTRRRATGVVYVLKKEGFKDKAWREAYDGLQRQGKVCIDLLVESGRVEFPVEVLEAVLKAGVDRFKTKQEPIKIFRFAFNEYFKKNGMVERVDPPKDDD